MPQKSKSRIIPRAILIAYSLLMLYWMFRGFGRATFDNYRYNLIPFMTVYEFFTKPISAWDFAVNIIGNIAVFMPYGALLPTSFGGRLKRSLLIFIVCVAAAEILQTLTKRGVGDVDDVILNIIGFFVGYWVYRMVKRRFR